MSGMIKYRVHEVGKDFGKTSKEITQILTDYATTPKNHMQVLEDPELNVIFDYLTQHNQIESLEEVFKVPPKAAKPKETAPAAQPGNKNAAAATAQSAATPPAKEKEPKPHVPRKVAEKRVVDTRGATTNLSKYDQHLDDLAVGEYHPVVAGVAPAFFTELFIQTLDRRSVLPAGRAVYEYPIDRSHRSSCFV